MVVGENANPVPYYRSFSTAASFSRQRDRKTRPYHRQPHPQAQPGQPQSTSTKEERDRQKLVEKKKRRLEKALATAAAIRLELENKKQRKKKEEEEQRLDEEGAALAEAVALHVLVDEEDSEASVDHPLQAQTVDGSGSNPSTISVEKTPPFEKETLNQGAIDSEPALLNNVSAPWGLFQSRGNIATTGSDSLGLVINKKGDWEVAVMGSLEQARCSSDKAIAAQLAAGLAAAQAVAALRIAEEARAEAEAAKKAAEIALSQGCYLSLSLSLSRQETCHQEKPQGTSFVSIQLQERRSIHATKPSSSMAMSTPSSSRRLAYVVTSTARVDASHNALASRKRQLLVEHTNELQPTKVIMPPNDIARERDELKAQLEETERKLKEKTRRVSELEGNLEEVTQHVLEMKALVGGIKSGDDEEKC